MKKIRIDKIFNLIKLKCRKKTKNRLLCYISTVKEVKKMLSNIYNNFKYLENALDGTWLRNKTIDQNIANVDTPNYKRKAVLFEDYLRKELNTPDKRLNITNEKHIPGIGNINNKPRIVEDKKLSYRFDGNNVNEDVEMAGLAKNTIMYDALTRQLIDEYDKIKNAIIEGGK